MLGTLESQSGGASLDEERSLAKNSAKASEATNNSCRVSVSSLDNYKSARLSQHSQNKSADEQEKDQGDAIIENLQQMGVTGFVIDTNSTESFPDIVMHIRQVIWYVARKNYSKPGTDPLGFQRCLLLKDQNGQLYNLLLSGRAGQDEMFKANQEGFSGPTAMIALTLLCRLLPCIAAGKWTRLYCIASQLHGMSL